MVLQESGAQPEFASSTWVGTLVPAEELKGIDIFIP